jgi:hypothetical protein
MYKIKRESLAICLDSLYINNSNFVIQYSISVFRFFDSAALRSE